MSKLTTDDIAGKTPDIPGSLDGLARQGARQMIRADMELEVEQYVQKPRNLRDKLDHATVVRNG